MKTCKKTLSLVLVFALVLSVFSFSANADFTDQDEITYEEAAVVLEALGVIDGYEDGSYQPDVVLSREEAAAIIARMKIGDNADNLTAGSEPFSDISTDRWSAGYIAYCVSEGIVDGFEDGTFRPEDELTCYQFAKMLLVALGYDAESEGLTGNTWATNTVSYAVNAGIFDDISSYSGSADRDTVAQMAYNTLLADLVEYPSGSIIIDSGDTSIVINGSDASRIENTGSETIEDDDYYQFAELYFSDLELVDVNYGDYGRPVSYNWELDGDVIYSGTAGDALLETYDSYVTKGTLYSLIGSSVYSDITEDNSWRDDGSSLYVYVDGEGGRVRADDVDYFIERSSSDYVGYNDESDSYYDGYGSYYCGYGVQTEVYVTDDNDVYLIFINTYLAVAEDDYDSDDGTLEVTCYGGLNEPYEDQDITLEDDEFDINGYVEGDYLLLTFDGGDVAAVEAADVISGEVTGYTERSSITVDGTRYYYASNIDAGEFDIDDDFAIDSDITLVLDSYGYVLGYDDATSSSSNYLYVLEIAQTGSLSSSGYEAAVFFTDGTYDEIDLRYSYYYEQNDNEVDYAEGTSQAGWYSYTVNSSGRYTLTEASSNRVRWAEGTGIEITNGSARYLSGEGDDESDSYTRFTATSSTAFIVYNVDDNDYDVYTGYNNVPNINAKNENSIAVYAVTASSGYSIAVVIYVDDEVSISGGGGTSDDFILVYGSNGRSVDSEGIQYYSYDAFVNGEETDIDSTEKLYAGTLYTDISYDEYGYIDEADPVTSSSADTDEYFVKAWSGRNDGVDIIYEDGVISIGTETVYPLASDYSIYIVDTSNGGDYDSVSASRFESMYDNNIRSATVYGVFNDDGEIVTIYVVDPDVIDD